MANNKRLTELTVGFWQDFYKGRLGRVALGAQYEYLKREAFEGIGGAPSTATMSSIRQYVTTLLVQKLAALRHIRTA